MPDAKGKKIGRRAAEAGSRRIAGSRSGNLAVEAGLHIFFRRSHKLKIEFFHQHIENVR